jgi:hypothetical protein
MRTHLETVEGLNELYCCTEGEERARVVEAMRVFGYPEFADTLLGEIYHDSEYRGAAVIAFSSLAGKRHTEHILRLLGDPDPDIVHYTFTALNNVTGDEIIEELHRLLMHPSCEIREEAARYLGKQCPSAFDAIHQVYMRGLIGEVAALDALSLTRDQRAIEALKVHLDPGDPLFSCAYRNLLYYEEAEALIEEHWQSYRDTFSV